MNDKPTLLDYVEYDLEDRNITIVDTALRKHCILAKDKEGYVLFIYAMDETLEMIFEHDYLGNVSAPRDKTFQYLLKKNNLKLITTEGEDFFREKLLSADQYNRLKKTASRINKTWKRRKVKDVKINSDDSVSIKMRNGKEWFFQDDEALELTIKAEKNDLHHFCCIEAVILHEAQSWC